jgi:hypothetical protein
MTGAALADIGGDDVAGEPRSERRVRYEERSRGRARQDCHLARSDSAEDALIDECR